MKNSRRLTGRRIDNLPEKHSRLSKELFNRGDSWYWGPESANGVFVSRGRPSAMNYMRREKAYFMDSTSILAPSSKKDSWKSTPSSRLNAKRAQSGGGSKWRMGPQRRWISKIINLYSSTEGRTWSLSCRRRILTAGIDYIGVPARIIRTQIRTLTPGRSPLTSI
ncbi:uncharacterized protein CC84DRAFT_655294 [Paraphaeosphaeria sporulosa]|uniref:Uncharacterized protein n=1 Tax=Paraphaeosphaeria sporulosa TaxID=1460663 RepID=A0A177CIK0_9PLEO|nr:uncharacterized protein CC84DRAFT_655294 [Paraphaeosphaeria sporulosa]OAG07333.1 hypothetical protein CC84DRAFT_655294 [Paraphaeosphaeria sporulosa]